MNRKPGVLILERKDHKDEMRFNGELFGYEVRADSMVDRGYGEIVFNTSMTGYQEILTDPSYFGQIVCLTVPHVGNTGVNREDPESKHPWCAGFLVHDFTEVPSNWRSEGSFENYLKEHKIPGLSGVDTRALTKYLRAEGVVRGVILPIEDAEKGAALLKKLPPFEGRDLISEVTTKKPYMWPTNLSSVKKTYKVLAVDYGVKWNLLRNLEERGCEIEVVPASITSQEILSRKIDGVFLSNGPGDPAMAPYASQCVKEILGKLPIFGVCMGHQILSIALGAKTYKLKFGHRGGNQPVMSSLSGQVEITSQNHGYAVDTESLPKNVVVTHKNLNDGTCEGLMAKDLNAFSVQYHPEACPGPHDSNKLFDVFIEMMKNSGHNK